MKLSSLTLIIVCAFAICLPTELVAQTGAPMSTRERLIKEQRERRAKQRDANSKKAGEPELAVAETVAITTKDKVVLKCTYFAGEKSKETVPIILLHDWDSNRKDLLPMAEFLQKNYKYSVIVPDLRGHGESTNVEGISKPIDFKKFKKKDVSAVTLDIERCKKFLMQKNNDGELNIEMLSIVTIGQLAVPAAQWVIDDWNWEPVGGRKQGRDVKALLMISPERKMKGLNINQNLKADLFSGKNGSPIAFYAVWAENDEVAAKEGAAIGRLMTKQRDKLTDKLLVIRQPYGKTGLSGTDLVRNPVYKLVYEDVHKFIKFYLIDNKEQMPWQNRAKK